MKTSQKAEGKRQKLEEGFFNKTCRFLLPFAFCLLPYCLPSCVPLDQLPPGSLPPGMTAGLTQAATGYADIEPPGTTISTMHFILRGYSENEIRPISVLAESLYDKIGNDTGLYSYLAAGNYKIVVYHDKDEFEKKTKLPGAVHAVAAGDTVYLYPSADLEPYFIHQLVHVILENFLSINVSQFKWLIEGTAMYEELSKMPDSEKAAYGTSAGSQLRSNKMSFSQMSFFVPASEEHRRTDVWFQQAESVVSYLLTQGGSSLNFGNLLNALHNASDIDTALNNAYSGKYHGMNDLETAWKNTIQ